MRTARVIFQSAAFKIEQSESGRVQVWRRGQPVAWQPPPVATEAFLERLGAIRDDEPWRDQSQVHEFLKLETEKG